MSQGPVQGRGCKVIVGAWQLAGCSSLVYISTARLVGAVPCGGLLAAVPFIACNMPVSVVALWFAGYADLGYKLLLCVVLQNHQHWCQDGAAAVK